MLARLLSLACSEGCDGEPQQALDAELLRSTCSAVLNATKAHAPSIAEQQKLWEAACQLWVSACAGEALTAQRDCSNHCSPLPCRIRAST